MRLGFSLGFLSILTLQSVSVRLLLQNESHISQILALIMIKSNLKWEMSAGIWNRRLVNIFYSFSHIFSCLTVFCLLQLCMLCSVGYHLFCCHRSEKTSRRWMALDYAGVSIGILGCYVPGVFYTFYCNNVSSACSLHSQTSFSSTFV